MSRFGFGRRRARGASIALAALGLQCVVTAASAQGTALTPAADSTAIHAADPTAAQATPTAAAPATEVSAGWRFSVTPYFWVPTIGSVVRYSIPGAGSDQTVEFDLGPGDYIDNLTLAAFLSGAAQKGRALIFTDVLYTGFSSERSAIRSVGFGGDRVQTERSIDAGTESTLKFFVWALMGGYSLVNTEKGSLDLFGGVRYTTMDVDTDWSLTTTVTRPGGSETFPRTGSVSGNQDLWDALVGVRGRLALGKLFFLPYHVDFGAGTSDFTWQGSLGLGHDFGSVDGLLVYRYLQYDGSDEDLLQEFSLSGVAFGAAIHF
jgi:hypothetical protein